MKIRIFVVIIALATLLSCKQETQNTPKIFFDVTFSHGEHGKLEASIEGNPFTQNKAEKDAIITFKATPDENYQVDS